MGVKVRITAVGVLHYILACKTRNLCINHFEIQALFLLLS